MGASVHASLAGRRVTLIYSSLSSTPVDLELPPEDRRGTRSTGPPRLSGRTSLPHISIFTTHGGWRCSRRAVTDLPFLKSAPGGRRSPRKSGAPGAFGYLPTAYQHRMPFPCSPPHGHPAADGMTAGSVSFSLFMPTDGARGESEPEAQVVVPVVWRVVVPVRRPAVPGIVVPAPAAVHAVGAPWRATPISLNADNRSPSVRACSTYENNDVARR